MNELKASPGPWVARDNKVYVGKRFVCEVHAGAELNIAAMVSRRNANAALIAASPELDNDLQAMCALWVSVCNAQGWDPNHVVQYGNALATLKKARGEA